jgi:hypothetical protein
MILIGIVGLCLVAILWVLLYLYFIRRTDRFMDNWEREIKEKAEKSTLKSIQALEEVAKGIERLPESIQSLEEAAEAIRTSRKAMEKLAYEKGFISKPPPEEIIPPEPVKESKLEPIASPSPSWQFAPYETRKRKDWEQCRPSRQPVLSFT